jgi:5'-nucleotidase/UDP-sugar diphosphatase
MNRMRRGLLYVFLLAAFAAAQQTRDLTILHTNDLHARLLPDQHDRGGFARLAGTIRQERQGCTWCILVNAGDMVQGTPVSTLFRGLPIYEIARLFRFDASTLGNHEFDYGWRQAQAFARKANFPTVSANVVDGEGRLFTSSAYVIRRVNGVRVAVIGGMLGDLSSYASATNLGPWRSTPPVEALRKYASELRQRADVVVLLAHMEVEEQEAALKQIPEINVVIGAHDHKGLGDFVEYEKRVWVRNNAYGVELGRLDLKVDVPARRLASSKWKRIPIGAASPVAANVARSVAKWEARVSKVVDKPIGESRRELARDELRVLLERAMAEQVGADFGLMNPGGVRDKLPKGRVLVRDIWNISPFDNYVVVGKFKGSELPETVTQTHPVDPGREYTLATLDFVVETGAMGLKGMKFPQRGPLLRDALVEWVKKKKVIE